MDELKQIEEKVHKRAVKRNLRKIILKSVLAAGLLGMAIVAPNAIQSLEKLGLLKLKGRYQEKTTINRTRDQLLEKGLMAKNKEGFLRITSEGKRLLRQIELTDYEIKKKKKWDFKWRLLIFDIPERLKNKRVKIRRSLFSVGFIRLQDSVWIYPYPCDDFVALLKAELKIGKDLLYLVVEEIENEKTLIKHFGLKK